MVSESLRYYNTFDWDKKSQVIIMTIMKTIMRVQMEGLLVTLTIVTGDSGGLRQGLSTQEKPTKKQKVKTCSPSVNKNGPDERKARN